MSIFVFILIKNISKDERQSTNLNDFIYLCEKNKLSNEEDYKETIKFNSFFILFIYSFINVLCIFKNPGIIPMQFINPIHLRQNNVIVS